MTARIAIAAGVLVTIVVAGATIAVKIGSRTAATPRHTVATCVLTFPAVSVADAKGQLRFPVYLISADAGAVLTSSRYSEGCDGARGLDLNYSVAGLPVELVEAAAPPPGTPLVRTKLGAAGAAGWTAFAVAGHAVQVDSTAGGKGLPAGVEEAVWASGSTMFTLTPHSPVDGGAPAPMSLALVQDVITHLTAA